MASDGPDTKGNTFELCVLDDSGMIDECLIVSEDELPEHFDPEQIDKLRAGEDDLIFINGKRGSCSKKVDESPDILTLAEVRKCVDDEECEIPNDVMLKALGPDARQVISDITGREVTVSADASNRGSDSDTRYHLHFGAGRLGMGLVVPAIAASGIPFAVIQRAKPRWISLFGQAGDGTKENQLGVSVNEQMVAHKVDMIESAEGTPSIMPPQSLIFGSTRDELAEVVDRATSLSCSLGSAMGDVMLPLLEPLPLVAKERQPRLFCCENDHDAVAKLKKQLEGRVHVIDCMVDRVCTARSITAEGVDVSAEPWHGSIVVLEPNLEGRLPFCSAVATAPRSELEAEYLSERKFSLVNGMHTVIAFMTLIDNFEEDDGGREYVLLKYTKIPRESQRMCEAWRTARAAQLIEKFGIDNLMEWHGCATAEAAWDVLLQYGDDVLEKRFSMTDDVVSRVLGGGVANRWQTRLKPTAEWLEARLGTTPAGGADGIARFFQYATRRDRDRALERGCDIEDGEWRGCDIEDDDDSADAEATIATYLSSLTDGSQRFCTREAQITHKQLIKEQRKAGGKANAPKVVAAMEAQKGKGI